MRRREFEEMEKIMALIRQASDEVKTAQHYTLILDRRAAYGAIDAAIDISDQVIQKVSQQAK